ncbi:MAG: phospholipid carrier-dependent glycosyltransferase [Chloroflexi bacterium]|nr:phospholipid carrier-dependent glycosyltransferase [Chloroflexota bacterium]
MKPAAHPSPWRWQSLAALLLLAVMFAQLLTAATQLSMTIDEGFHITSGYGYLRTGQMRLMDEHVPLVKALFSWPLFFVPDLAPPEQADGWAKGDLISVAQETLLPYQPIDRVIVAPRVLVALLTLLLAATVYRWAANCFGPTAGLCALALMTFDPNILAHGSLATTDMGAVAFIFWAVWAFARYQKAPTSQHRWWAAALLLGLAQGAKLTATLLLPVLGLLTLIDTWMKGAKDKARTKTILRRTVSYGAMVMVSALVVWGLYLFELRTLPQVAQGTIPLPAASHIERWLRLRDVISYGRESFLLGQNGMHGWWQYFPLAFVLKTPLLTLTFTALTIAALLFGRRRGIMDELTVGLFPLVYAVFSLTSTINIGYRHLLPVLPFLFVSASRLTLVARERAARIAGWVLIACLCVGTLSISPHYLAYFNPIAGGMDHGYRYLADSNTDWGQTFKALAEHQRRNNLEPVKLSTFTFLDPATYGVRYEPIAPMTSAPPVLPRRFNPGPGLYAISATTLDGVPLPLPSTYDWFQHRPPQAKIGHVMFLYEVEESQGNWVAQCTLPVVPLTADVIAQGFGSNSLRRIYFDCETSWVFPDGGASVGWYARTTPGIDKLRWPVGGERLEWYPDWVKGLNLTALRLSYVQPTPGDLPPFTIWEWTGRMVTPPATIEQGDVTLDGTLTFLGYYAPQSTRQGTSVEVLTYWRVVERPSRPLSLMLHLTDANGVPIATGDRLGVTVEQWQPGDVIVQRHVLTIPNDAPLTSYQLRGGAYWLDDMTRLMASDDDNIALAFIEIE